MTKNEIIEAIIEGLEQHFGRDKDVGCYTYYGAWLSLNTVIDVIEDVIKYDVYLPTVEQEQEQEHEEQKEE